MGFGQELYAIIIVQIVILECMWVALYEDWILVCGSKRESHRTDEPFNKKENSSICDHSIKCTSTLSINNSKILDSYIYK